MRTIKKRLSALLLSVYMVFGVVSTDYLTVQAFEWVVPSLTVGESLLWLMGLLGMTYTEGASAWRDVSPEYEQEFIDYANEHGLTYTETSTWLNDAASGKLNQLSDVWTNFKEWVKSLFSSSGSGVIYTDFLGAVQSVVPSVTKYEILNSSISDFNFKYAFYVLNSDNSYYFVFLDDSYTPDFSYSNSCVFVGNGNYLTSAGNSIYNNSTSIYFNLRSGSQAISFNNNTPYYVLGVPISDFVGANNVHEWALDGSSSDSDFDVYNPALIPDINFAGANTEDASIPGVIDLPWGNLGDDEAERDKTYDDLVGGLDLGKEIGDLWQALQNLMGVLAVDDAGVLQPNSGGENPPTLEDEAENNKVNGAFVLTGLQKVFPFCIPFDLYAFITLLEAPPVAPVIQYPIYNPVTKSNEIITIDFSTWESVVVLFRYIFDFLFIIGLLLMARALIGGGDSA